MTIGEGDSVPSTMTATTTSYVVDVIFMQDVFCVFSMCQFGAHKMQKKTQLNALS